MVAAVAGLLELVAPSWHSQAAQQSASRYVRWLLQTTAGTHASPSPSLPNGYALEASSLPVCLHIFHLPFSTVCEHHMLPFHGKAHVACRSSLPPHVLQAKLSEALLVYSHRLQVQERLTHQLAETLQQLPGTSAVAVVCQAAHLCMIARGVESHSSRTLTTAARGEWAVNHAGRAAAMAQLTAAALAAGGL